MASRDPAFQWETEMLRSSRHHPRADSRSGGIIEDAGDWLTLREASEATGVPTSTIRKWARHENVPSFLEKTSDGYLRVVSMSGIKRWTEEIGRDIEAPDPEPAEVDLTSQEHGDPEPGAHAVPEGSMIVPLDAWNRMLNQLGNLHEAGQQLAEARERAAKAETETRFLKERLADLREELESARASTSSTPSESSAGDVPATASPISIVKTLYDAWRIRRRDRR